MNKIWIIIKREYITRVRKKTFLLTTILTPLLFVGFMAFVIFMTIRNISHEKVAVVDPAGYLKSSLESSKTITYSFVTDIDTGNFVQKGYSAVLFAPNTSINQTPNFRLITEKSLNRIANSKIEKDISRALENNLISQELKIDPKRIDSLKSRAESISLNTSKKGDDGLRNSSFEVANVVGYVTAFLIYITLLIYGTMVMRGVTEEKTNRIAEVMVSSVRPVQLMMGKIIGIGAVGLTQFLIWIALIGVLSTIMTSMIPADVLQQAQQASEQVPGQSQQGTEMIRNMAKMQVNVLSTINWPLVIGCFIFYFIGGYLFYASLFAAVGSAVNEDPQDAQSLMFPITLPVILAIIIMINAINDPGGSLATWSSLIPFFSPIVMMARIPFGVPDTVPYWQLGTSMLLLILGFLFTTWLSAKIYRTGILLYGKKPTLKEMAKWITR
jgi:ABC-2 type transport system permease protein